MNAKGLILWNGNRNNFNMHFECNSHIVNITRKNATGQISITPIIPKGPKNNRFKILKGVDKHKK